MAARKRLSEVSERKVYNKANGKCFYCGDKLEYEDMLDWGGKVVTTRRHWEIDHFVPMSRGGTDNMDNYAPACKSCNGCKGTQTVEEFRNDPYIVRKTKGVFYFEKIGVTL